jgi:hypothetical protein
MFFDRDLDPSFHWFLGKTPLEILGLEPGIVIVSLPCILNENRIAAASGFPTRLKPKNLLLSCLLDTPEAIH